MCDQDESPHSVDDVDLQQRVTLVNQLIASHLGSINLEEVRADGTVRVKFTGFCEHCVLRPSTLSGIINPLLGEVEGVTRVEAVGVRLSEDAERSLNLR